MTLCTPLSWHECAPLSCTNWTPLYSMHSPWPYTHPSDLRPLTSGLCTALCLLCHKNLIWDGDKKRPKVTKILVTNVSIFLSCLHKKKTKIEETDNRSFLIKTPQNKMNKKLIIFWSCLDQRKTKNWKNKKINHLCYAHQKNKNDTNWSLSCRVVTKKGQHIEKIKEMTIFGPTPRQGKWQKNDLVLVVFWQDKVNKLIVTTNDNLDQNTKTWQWRQKHQSWVVLWSKKDKNLKNLCGSHAKSKWKRTFSLESFT